MWRNLVSGANSYHTAQAVPDTPIPTTSPFTGKSITMQVTEGLDLTGNTIPFHAVASDYRLRDHAGE
jgi:hypothetical protein